MNFYRYKNVNTTAGIRVDEWKYSLVKETAKGYWICAEWYFHGSEFASLKKDGLLRWVSKTARKKFAYETREAAWNSYQMRKLREIKILRERLDVAQAAYSLKQPEEGSSSQVSGLLGTYNDCPYGA
jgi:hypothetical protein